jgi:hypothetical protein
MLDRSTPAHYTTTVAGKYKANGKVTTYHLKLNPWGNHTEGKEVKVTRDEYQQINAGDSLVVTERQGYLKMPWIEIRPSYP